MIKCAVFLNLLFFFSSFSFSQSMLESVELSRHASLVNFDLAPILNKAFRNIVDITKHANTKLENMHARIRNFLHRKTFFEKVKEHRQKKET